MLVTFVGQDSYMSSDRLVRFVGQLSDFRRTDQLELAAISDKTVTSIGQNSQIFISSDKLVTCCCIGLTRHWKWWKIISSDRLVTLSQGVTIRSSDKLVTFERGMTQGSSDKLVTLRENPKEIRNGGKAEESASRNREIEESTTYIYYVWETMRKCRQGIPPSVRKRSRSARTSY